MLLTLLYFFVDEKSRVKFFANRPFFFAIRDAKGAYVMGRVVNPK